MANTRSNARPLGGSVISQQVATQLLQDLKTGCYATEARLPAEIELADRLNVSRTVIRDALSELEREGYVERVRGIGTVINRIIVNLEARLDQKFEYNEMIKDAGHTPNADNVSIHLEIADSHLAEKLNITVGDSVLVVEKRVLADDQPVIWSSDFLPASFFPPVMLERLDFSRPIYDLLDESNNLSIYSTAAKLCAVKGDESIRNTLMLPEHEALLLLEELHFSRLAEPVLYSLTYYTQFFEFTMFRKKI